VRLPISLSGPARFHAPAGKVRPEGDSRSVAKRRKRSFPRSGFVRTEKERHWDLSESWMKREHG